jgi:hypothetical protein
VHGQVKVSKVASIDKRSSHDYAYKKAEAGFPSFVGVITDKYHDLNDYPV